MKDFRGLGMIFVMDVDGTICFNGLFIEDILQSEIERIGTNHQIIFASARPIRDLLPVVKGFESPILIGGNGSIVSINNEVSVVKSIPINAFEYIKSLIIKNDLEYIIDGSFDYSANVNPNNKYIGN
ncbi:HAD hydrolase family protein [Mammaliicoccus sciuri]|uniref:HAD hydrolase family protein n=1 Tax=Mammaliicoccus sciuri TaxID=1296 RepID=UPI00397E5862